MTPDLFFLLVAMGKNIPVSGSHIFICENCILTIWCLDFVVQGFSILSLRSCALLVEFSTCFGNQVYTLVGILGSTEEVSGALL